MQIHALLKPLEDLEATLCRLYRWFGELFSTDAEASKLFYRLSLEEKAHQSLVQYQRRLVNQNPTHFQEVDADLSEVRIVLARIDEMLHKRQPPTIHEAVQAAWEIECSSAEQHSRTAIIQANPALTQLLLSLIRGDEDHKGALSGFAKGREIPLAPPKVHSPQGIPLDG